MKKTYRIIFSCLIFGCSFMVYSCKSIDSNPMLTGSESISDETFRDLIRIEVTHNTKTKAPSMCSGLIVAHNAVLTAANCLGDAKEIKATQPDTRSIIKPIKTLAHPQCKNQNECYNNTNIAVLVFADNSFSLSTQYQIDTKSSRSPKTTLKLTSYARKTRFEHAHIFVDNDDYSSYKQSGNTNVTKLDLCTKGMIQAGYDDQVYAIEEKAPDSNNVIATSYDAGGVAVLASNPSRVVGLISHGIANKYDKYIGLAIAQNTVEVVKRASCIVDFANKDVINFLKKAKSELKIGIYGIN